MIECSRIRIIDQIRTTNQAKFVLASNWKKEWASAGSRQSQGLDGNNFAFWSFHLKDQMLYDGVLFTEENAGLDWWQ